MKKKAISILMCAIMLVAMLTGCIHQDMGVKMNRDGSGSIIATLGIEKDFYEQLKGNGSDPFEGKSITEYEWLHAPFCTCFNGRTCYVESLDLPERHLCEEELWCFDFCCEPQHRS